MHVFVNWFYWVAEIIFCFKNLDLLDRSATQFDFSLSSFLSPVV